MPTTQLIKSTPAADATPMLCGVPQTMLWTLHNRATESLRPDAWFHDPDAERIFKSIAFDYRAHFGRPDSSHATRSQMFDEALRPWLATHPGGTVVELGCGLETQFRRCDDGRVRWLCVDVPDAIAVRERYLAPSERCRHLALSALDLRWMDGVGAANGVFITAQGLLMYFPEEEVRRLVSAITERFKDGELMFDTIPRWFSRKTMDGFDVTRHYRAPPMPWGIDRDEIETTLRAWSPRITSVSHEPYRRFRTFPARLGPWMARIPVLAKLLPAIVRVRFAGD